MCGRYYIDKRALEASASDTGARYTQEISEVVEDLQENLGNWEGNVSPSQKAAVLAGKDGHLSYEVMTWGFPPSQGKGLVINARAETVLEKRMFRESALRRRCVIPAGHFYEWDADKNKASFSDKASPVLYMAGIYQYFREEKCFVILTVAANASVKKVHDRMPLLLDKTEIERWIFEDGFLDYALHKTPAELEKYQEYEQTSLAEFGLEF